MGISDKLDGIFFITESLQEASEMMGIDEDDMDLVDLADLEEDGVAIIDFDDFVEMVESGEQENVESLDEWGGLATGAVAKQAANPNSRVNKIARSQRKSMEMDLDRGGHRARQIRKSATTRKQAKGGHLAGMNRTKRLVRKHTTGWGKTVFDK